MAIRVFLVEDSPIALHILEQILQAAPGLEVVGTAQNGKDALLRIPESKPDVICTDLYMKEMDGVELTRQIMARYPRPILVISVAVGQGNEQNAFQLLQAGAIDVFPKPGTGLIADYDRGQLINKIKVLAGVKVFTRPLRPTLGTPTNGQSSGQPSSPPIKFQQNGKYTIIGIGASTGGPQAIAKILSKLPGNFPLPILCTQHISMGFLEGLVSWIRQECALKVKIGETGETPQPGVVYFAPDQCNLELDRRGKLLLSAPTASERHCPSVNVMLRSLALVFGQEAIGILLTGMGDDGADGMRCLAAAGGLTIAQDEATCIVYGMPKEAIALGAVQHTLAIDAIGESLVTYCRR
ncbi:chemotaxis-specific protein-glutamate methyltransferase CheB [Candidatus Synechococcus calcipolaris G9]|uniref:Protein-glutamate methylesterase/protein-glutamine glutaminase n=1 Tax=Candidatus Synechococcus calcipolaris G9 TaxID=1497997 RepID=A0ABT6EZJ4_9SYNE|nr:chemotaxis-specific protein-glutamate methyltransferase CheB [Candidatus Synechococcus calcipolaris]MDG2991003.1 chemotaxis-specific protein-glutamate methyltransferase CheB [Candidatus Synechococcus calcipolaris G9]